MTINSGSATIFNDLCAFISPNAQSYRSSFFVLAIVTIWRLSIPHVSGFVRLTSGDEVIINAHPHTCVSGGTKNPFAYGLKLSLSDRYDLFVHDGAAVMSSFIVIRDRTTSSTPEIVTTHQCDLYQTRFFWHEAPIYDPI